MRWIARFPGKDAQEMKTNREAAAILIIMAAAVSLGFTSTGNWQKRMAGILEPQINCILADRKDNNVLYVGTSQALYMSNNQGRSFQPTLRIQGSEKGINYIYQEASHPVILSPAVGGTQNLEILSPPRRRGQDDHNDDGVIYAATDSGLYTSDNQGKKWQSIFNPADTKARRNFTVFKDEKVFYAGTLGGLYHKYPGNPNWERERGDLGNTPIYKILADDQYYYFVNDRRLFRKKKENDELKVIFDAGVNSNEDLADENEETTLPQRKIKDFLAASSFLLVANDGISYSLDQGQTWKSLPTAGLPNNALTSIAIKSSDIISHGSARGVILMNEVMKDPDPSPSSGAQDDPLKLEKIDSGVIYAGTTKGVFQFVDNHWAPLYQGMETDFIQALTLDNEGTLYAATARGLFFRPAEKTLALDTLARHPDDPAKAGEEGSPRSFAGVQNDISNFNNEPSIREVQNWAIDYAEVHPNKIKGWRRGAKYRAIMPTVSVGLDRDATEYFHWDSGPNPDNLLKGRDFMDWDFSISWDFGDLIWNPDQTSIDSRSKLMVELREDIMDQVTRLYFERRRVQVEMREPSTDSQEKLDQEMRLAELTALIDSLTGGAFSERIEKWKKQRVF